MNKVIESNSWPIEEAKKILERINNKTPEKGYVLFETGYGPSGLPHIGTFGEVARTTMVRHAFHTISDIPSKLIAFSDDMDGLRKVPENVPNRDMLKAYIGKPLTSIPDPFDVHQSYAHYMNAKLRSFLDRFEFEYEFKSATECYKSGMFDEMLLNALRHFDDFLEVMLPTLGEERQATYSPFLPVCPETGVVLQVPIIARDVENGTITYNDPRHGGEVTVPVTKGSCKMQWKADWALRWCTLDVDYEMHGKDLIPTSVLSNQLCRILKHRPPILLTYELFLDQDGKKISKSIGNGITIEEWLKYAPTESLSLFMYQSPNKAKRLYFDVIPKAVDEYLTYIRKYHESETEDFNNPVWHIHSGKVPKIEMYDISFNLLLNLASACNPEDKNVLWGFIHKYSQSANPGSAPFLDGLVDYAIAYYNDFIKPSKTYKIPSENEIILLDHIISKLESISSSSTAEEIQNAFYQIGKENTANLRDYFGALYEMLLGQKEGPRLGSFVSLYGIDNTIKLIKEAKDRRVEL
jgi:lysyl-tRNA synthetase, class I